MSVRTPTDAPKHGFAWASLAAYLGRHLISRSVCVVGPADALLVGALRRVAARVDATAARPKDTYDCVIVPDLSHFPEVNVPKAVQPYLKSGGLAVFGSSAQGEGAYEKLFEKVAASFAHLKMVGEAPFAAYSLVDFGAEGEPSIVFDGTLLGEASEAPTYYFAIASAHEMNLDAYAIVQVPVASMKAAPTVVAAPAPVVATPVPAPVVSAPAPVSEVNDEVVALETQLHEQARLLMEARAEVERRGTLARDLLEELVELRKTGGANPNAAALAAREQELEVKVAVLEKEKRAAVARVIDAEAKKTEALFRVDELMGQLSAEKSHAQPKASDGDANDTTRALRARVSELEELHDGVHGRLALAEQDMKQAQERIRTLERELAEARDEIELEIARKHSESAALKPERY